MAIEAVLFDYSGVLTTGFTFPTEDVPYDPERLFTEMVTALSTSDGHAWHDLERGAISLAEFIEQIEQIVPGAGVLFAVGSEHNVMANLDLLDDRLALVGEIRDRGLRTGLVTNNVAEWRPLWRDDLPHGLFDVIVDSADVGCRKPDPEIYQLALAQLEVADPANAVFIDDFEWNVVGAKSVGMHAVHCTADTDMRRDLLSVIDTDDSPLLR